MTAEQCRAKGAALVAQADQIDLTELRDAFRAQASYLLEQANDLERRQPRTPRRH